MTIDVLKGLEDIVNKPFEKPGEINWEGLLSISEHDPYSTTSHGLQVQNLAVLLGMYGGHIKEKNIEFHRGRIIDTGCGDFMLGSLCDNWLLPYLRRISGLDDYETQLIGFDEKVKKVIRALKLNTKKLGSRHIVLNPVDLGNDDLTKVKYGGRLISNDEFLPGNSSMDLTDMDPSLIICNSVFHWIKDYRQKKRAIKSFYKIQKEGDAVLMSVASEGTARLFLQAYQSEVEKAYVEHEKAMRNYKTIQKKHGQRQTYSKGKKERLIARFNREIEHKIENPLGFMKEDKLVEIFQECGYRVVTSQTLDTSNLYDSPEDYLRAVNIYGFENFTEPLKKIMPRYADRRNWWETKLKKAFLELAGPELKEGKWKYTQSNIYVLAVKDSNYHR